MDREARIRELAGRVHAAQQYGDLPYWAHLDDVEAELAAAGMNSTSDRIIARSHDVIEDVDPAMRDEVTADLRSLTTDFEFRMIWALTGQGPNRKSRNLDMKNKIALDGAAANYKLADRNANWRSSLNRETSQAGMYLREDADFTASVVALATNEKLIANYTALRERAIRGPNARAHQH